MSKLMDSLAPASPDVKWQMKIDDGSVFGPVTTAGLAAELTTYRAKLETLDTLAASMGKA